MPGVRDVLMGSDVDLEDSQSQIDDFMDALSTLDDDEYWDR